MTNTLIGYGKKTWNSARARAGVICPYDLGTRLKWAATDHSGYALPRVLEVPEVSSVVPKRITHREPEQRTLRHESSLLCRATLGEYL